MPAFLTELAPLEFDLTAYGQNYVRAYDPRWHVCLGIDLMDFMLDARNVVVVGSQAAIEIIPFIQFATTRTDRPGAPIEISGTPLGADNIAHYQQALTTTWSGANEFYVRRGVAVRLNANGTFGRARGFLHTAFRNVALVLPSWSCASSTIRWRGVTGRCSSPRRTPRTR